MRDIRAGPRRLLSRSSDKRARPVVLRWRAGRRDPVWSRDAQLHSAVELPRFVEREPDDQNPDDVFETGEKRRRIENPDQQDDPDDEAERANRFGLGHYTRGIR